MGFCTPLLFATAQSAPPCARVAATWTTEMEEELISSPPASAHAPLVPNLRLVNQRPLERRVWAAIAPGPLVSWSCSAVKSANIRQPCDVGKASRRATLRMRVCVAAQLASPPAKRPARQSANHRLPACWHRRRADGVPAAWKLACGFLHPIMRQELMDAPCLSSHTPNPRRNPKPPTAPFLARPVAKETFCIYFCVKTD